MSETTAERRDSLAADEARRLWPARLVIGLVQGLLLLWLFRSASAEPPVWPATEAMVLTPLSLVVAFVPVAMLSGVGRLPRVTLAIWTVVASVVLALIAVYDIARQAPADEGLLTPSPAMVIFAAVALFIAHHLLLPASAERRLIAGFAAYFDTTWKSGVQLIMALAFTGVFWVLLGLGAALFGVIGLTFLGDLISQDWFAIPVTTLVFAVAVHLADVREGLIRGVRTVALMLLSWLLPLMTVLAAGFLIALPFTGLDDLWATGSAASILLASMAVLIVLINTAYQDGRIDNRPPRVLRISVRVAAILLLPLAVIALWALFLRIGQYGLTPDRIIALACAVVGAQHAVGYVYAATRRENEWMRPLERTNIFGGMLALALILALLSPVLDPARLSVADQVARLERGAVSAEDFDYRFLRFESGAAGLAALERLADSDDAAIAANAGEALAIEDRWTSDQIGRPVVEPRYEVLGEAALPSGFLGPVSPQDGRAICTQDGMSCVARAIDLDGDGEPEVLLHTYQLQLWDNGEEAADRDL